MLADIILKVAEMESQQEQEYRPRPSLAGPQRCIRQLVYHGLCVPRKPIPGRAVLIFDDSSWHEELTADWIRKSAFQLHSQQMPVTIKDEATGIVLPGHIDGIITDILTVDRLLEHKAINHFTFQKYCAGEIPLDYVAQCCLYIRGLQADNPSISEAVLLVKNKNTAQYMEFLIHYHREADMATILNRTMSWGETIDMGDSIENITREAFDKFHLIDTHIKAKTLPARQYDRYDDETGWHCDYCGWGGLCWEGYEHEFESLKADGMLSAEIEDMVRYYKELGAQKGDIEKEYKALSEQIKKLIEDSGHRQGKAGDYLCKLKLQETRTIDKSLLTPAEIQKATKVNQSKRLYVSHAKEAVS